MAYTCSWPCVSETAPSVSAMVQSEAPVQIVSTAPKSFAAALAGATVIDDRPLPTPCIKGDALCIKICQDEYRKGVDDCKHASRARLTLNKGDKPYSARDLSNKIGKLWKTTAGWKMVPLGKGYYDFHFDSADDLRKIWAVGTVNLSRVCYVYHNGLKTSSTWHRSRRMYRFGYVWWSYLKSIGGREP